MVGVNRLLSALSITVSAVLSVSCTSSPHESLGGVDVSWDYSGRRDRVLVGRAVDPYAPPYAPNSYYRPVQILVRTQNSNSHAIASVESTCGPVTLELGPVSPHQTKFKTATVPGSTSGSMDEFVKPDSHCALASVAWDVGNQKYILRSNDKVGVPGRGGNSDEPR